MQPNPAVNLNLSLLRISWACDFRFSGCERRDKKSSQPGRASRSTYCRCPAVLRAMSALGLPMMLLYPRCQWTARKPRKVRLIPLTWRLCLLLSLRKSQSTFELTCPDICRPERRRKSGIDVGENTRSNCVGLRFERSQPKFLNQCGEVFAFP